MPRLRRASEPSIIADRSRNSTRAPAAGRDTNGSAHMTFTGAIGAVCMFPLRAIIRASVALGIHPNVLTLVGVLINVGAGFALGRGHFIVAGLIMIVANIFDFIDGKVAHITGKQSTFGAFWDSTLDRFSDLALFTGLVYLYSRLGSHEYVLVATLTLIFATMTSYARARAESLVDKCKVGFMERPERIVLFMIGAFTNRMAGVMWVILVLSVFSVADRVILTYRTLNQLPERPTTVARAPLPARMVWNAFFWTFERATWQYDVMVIAILAFVWLTPPDWIGDPTAHGFGPLGLLG